MDDLSEEQRTTLRQFSERVSGLLSPELEQDHMLLRWLVARNFNIDKAEEMVKKSAEWRKEHGVAEAAEWRTAEVMERYLPVGQLGRDRYGGQVLLIPHGLTDTRGLIKSLTPEEHMNHMIKLCESQQKTMLKDSELLGKPVYQQTVIFDMEGFSYKDFTWKPALDLVLQQVQMYDANYPEMLRCAFVINAPRVFTLAFALLKPFLHEATVRKVRLFGAEGWKEAVLGDVEPHVLPRHWGGEREDPGGDGRCPSVVKMGGKVPEEYYISNRTKRRQAALTRLVVERGAKAEACLDVVQAGVTLRWQVEVEQHDIGFSVEGARGAAPPRRVESREGVVAGSLLCEAAGRYRLVFDNSYSYLRSKTVHYAMELQAPS